MAVLASIGMSDGYWRGPTQDEVMQDEHGFIWRAMLDTVDVDLSATRVLDAGCNRGGFLRLLVDHFGVAEGFGYDPASSAIADARYLAGERRLTFETADTVPPGWEDFDVVFSHEVLYLLPDLGAHADAVCAALRPGCPYFAVTGVHAGNPLMVEWHAAHATDLSLPDLRDLDEVACAFEEAGFEVYAARLKFGFIPVSAHRSGGPGNGCLTDWLAYYNDDKVVFRFTKPPTTA
jgi:SAM-dependent methyltransferase